MTLTVALTTGQHYRAACDRSNSIFLRADPRKLAAPIDLKGDLYTAVMPNICHVLAAADMPNFRNFLVTETCRLQEH